MLEQFVFLAMILIALFITLSRNLKYAVLALSAFSLLAAFSYLLFHAPDVAIAEAVIGSALSTIIYIIALKKYQTFYIYITSDINESLSDLKILRDVQSVLLKVISYCHDHDMQAQYVYTYDSPDIISNEHVCDLILVHGKEKVYGYGLETELHVQNIRKLLLNDSNFNFVPLLKGGEDESI